MAGLRKKMFDGGYGGYSGFSDAMLCCWLAAEEELAGEGLVEEGERERPKYQVIMVFSFFFLGWFYCFECRVYYIYLFIYYLFFNVVLTWKIMETLEALGYIYIYIYRLETGDQSHLRKT